MREKVEILEHHSQLLSYLVKVNSLFVYLLAVAYMFYYALIGCKNVNKDIPVD